MNATIEVHTGQYQAAVTDFITEHYFRASHFDFASIEQLRMEIEAEDREYGEFSTIAIARGANGVIQSTARLIERPLSGGQLPCERACDLDISSFGDGAARVFEFARLASTRASERGVAWLLAERLRSHCALDPRRDRLIAGIDAQLLALLQARGWPFTRLGPAVFYCGSYTVPILIDIAGARRKILQGDIQARRLNRRQSLS